MPWSRAPAMEVDSGFTLIELLIVVLVLGILATIVSFGVGGFAAPSASAACKTDAKSVETAAAAYYLQNGNTWPANLAQLTPGYLRQRPSNANYTITLGANGIVTGTLTPTNGGGTCYTSS